MSENKVQIIGVGDDGLEGLTAAARKYVDQADLLIGAEKSLNAVARDNVETLDIGADLEAIVRRIEKAGDERVVLLASGDPLFFGTARFLCDRLGKERFDVLPHVSSMQLAFARVKETWDEAYLTNLATQNLDRVAENIRSAEKAGLFTTETITPAVVSRALLDRRIDYFSAYVCENLGSPDERVTQGELAEIAGLDFAALNVMILVRKPNIPDRPVAMRGQRLFGNPDEAFLQSKPKRGLLTPSEVRSIALAELDLGPTSVVWDVGAGSGAVAIEAAQIARQGSVFAIEMDPEDFELIAENANRFGVGNLTPILGTAPEAWEKLADPDAVFVGGTGRMVAKIVEQAFARLRAGGRIIAKVNSLENVNAVRAALHACSGDDRVWMINISRGVYQLEQVRLESTNPTFLIGARKK